jgi:hypothetical protein
MLNHYYNMQLNKIISIVVVVVLMSGCADFLNETPRAY